MSRNRCYCFTAFNTPILVDTAKVEYMIYQPECCPTTKKAHFQGYIELKCALSLQSIKKLFCDDTIHFEKRLGSQRQAINYCKKSESAIGNPIVYGTPKNQGHRTDLDEIYEDCIEGMTSKEILINHGGNALRHIHCIKSAIHSLWNLDKTDQHILQMREFVGDNYKNLLNLT